jgi:hypothetical protein
MKNKKTTAPPTPEHRAGVENPELFHDGKDYKGRSESCLNCGNEIHRMETFCSQKCNAQYIQR